MPTAAQRKNLLKLAAYLESLPRNYKHFDMRDYAGHEGSCELAMDPFEMVARKPEEFLQNCGTVACALGHGPAAGVKLRPDEYSGSGWAHFAAYSVRAFGVERWDRLFYFLFDSDWRFIDNHHYGAAARIRYFLTTGEPLETDRAARRKYAPYRKGSRSATRREIERVSL